jgi:hypothetical protein
MQGGVPQIGVLYVHVHLSPKTSRYKVRALQSQKKAETC